MLVKPLVNVLTVMKLYMVSYQHPFTPRCGANAWHVISIRKGRKKPSCTKYRHPGRHGHKNNPSTTRIHRLLNDSLSCRDSVRIGRATSAIRHQRCPLSKLPSIHPLHPRTLIRERDVCGCWRIWWYRDPHSYLEDTSDLRLGTACLLAYLWGRLCHRW